METTDNVGTALNPVSWLHERAVALIYDQLMCVPNDLPLDAKEVNRSEVRVRLKPSGEMSGNLLDGVTKVIIPGEWDNVGGIVPDLILKDANDNPVRIIEVVVTNPIDKQKREKIQRLERRGVECVEITVKAKDDLLNLCWVPCTVAFADYDARELERDYRRRRATGVRRRLGKKYQGRFSARAASEKANEEIKNLIHSLTMCSPGHRRQFLEVFDELRSLDSLLPVHPLNPKKDALENIDHHE